MRLPVAVVAMMGDLTREQAAAIEKGMDKFGVLVFRGQRLSDETQMAFSRNFGELELATHNLQDAKGQRLGAHINDVSNLDANNNVLGRDDRRRLFLLGTRLWHSDSSFKVVPAKYSLLSARIIPSKGGNTEFADMRAAWDTLDDATKAECEGLVCEHSQLFSRELIGFSDFRTFSFSSRNASAWVEVGGSMATRQRSCSMWFCTMSRKAPAVS